MLQSFDDAVRYESGGRMSEFQTKLHEAFQQAQTRAAARARELEQEARKVLETLGDRAQAELKILLASAARGSREQLSVPGVPGWERHGREKRQDRHRLRVRRARPGGYVCGPFPPAVFPPRRLPAAGPAGDDPGGPGSAARARRQLARAGAQVEAGRGSPGLPRSPGPPGAGPALAKARPGARSRRSTCVSPCATSAGSSAGSLAA